MDRTICIHGHFYQPPREHAWLEEVELQDSAYPYHDWNERVTAECYAPNTASRILSPDKRITQILNNYSKISFNFGPTLLSWMDRNRPDVYAAILAADRLSGERFSGHGSALAQVYNHMIMPLGNKRDQHTQVRWGIQDFQRRFGRFPEGMWLPETAVDLQTLQVLAEMGLRFTILAPNQIKRLKKIGRGKWQDVSGGRIDPTRPYLCRLPSGLSICLFVYDGPISQAVAFGGLLGSGEAFSERLISAFSDSRDWPPLVHIATDGETYGHHHRHGDMALAYCLHALESAGASGGGVRLTNYGEYLEKYPPTHQVEIFEGSSWSCAHGIERWREDCGCSSGAHPGWNQAWRRPLREALDRLRSRLAAVFGREAARYLADPWQARNEYIEVIGNRSQENVQRFLNTHAQRELGREEGVAVLKLLEMQRNAMLMYTSCGWFFDEISGIETVQVLQYAARAIQLAEDLGGSSLEPEFIALLKKAPSNIYSDGSEPYERFVRTARVDLLRVGGHYAISSLFETYPRQARIYCYTADAEAYECLESGKLKLVLGRTRIRSEITWEEGLFSFAVLHLGDHNISGGIRAFQGEEAFNRMQEELRGAFERADITQVVQLMNQHFGDSTYTLWHLFRDEQRKVMAQLLQITQENVSASYRRIYQEQLPLMNFLRELGIPLPKPLRVAAEFILNDDLRGVFEKEELDLDRFAKLVQEAGQWFVEVDSETLEYLAPLRIHALMERFCRKPEDTVPLEAIDRALGLLEVLSIDLDLWKTQNLYFSVGKTLYPEMVQRAERESETGTEEGTEAGHWVQAFRRLGEHLKVHLG